VNRRGGEDILDDPIKEGKLQRPWHKDTKEERNTMETCPNHSRVYVLQTVLSIYLRKRGVKHYNFQSEEKGVQLTEYERAWGGLKKVFIPKTKKDLRSGLWGERRGQTTL